MAKDADQPSMGDKIKESLGLDSELSAGEALGLKARTPRDQLSEAEREARDDEDNNVTAAVFGSI